MNYIYTNKKNHRKYVLNPEITMGDKVCLTDMITCEDKFLAVSTLKRSYSQQVVDYVLAELKAFTGMTIGIFRMHYVNYHWSIYTKSGKWLDFDDDGKQLNAKNPKYANKLGMVYEFQESALEWVIS